jgi:hypothetical protein
MAPASFSEKGMMRRLAAMAAGLAMACVAHAQYDAGATVGLGQGVLLNNSVIGSNVMGDVIAHQDRDRRASTASPAGMPLAGRDLAALSYRPSAAVSQAVLDRVARQFGGDHADAYRQALVRDGVLEKFDALLREYGFAGRNVADAFTAYLVSSWEVVNDRDADAYRGGIEALRTRMRAAMARNPRIAALADAQKQELAETFGYLAMIAAGARSQLERSGDRAALARLQEGVNSTARKMGVDLRAVAMTPQGFVAR